MCGAVCAAKGAGSIADTEEMCSEDWPRNTWMHAEEQEQMLRRLNLKPSLVFHGCGTDRRNKDASVFNSCCQTNLLVLALCLQTISKA